MKSIKEDLTEVTKKVGNVVVHPEHIIEPVRESLFKRFPIVSTLLVTFGFTATLFGIEGIISQIAWLDERPHLILIMGLCTLMFTGKLYQKLG